MPLWVSWYQQNRCSMFLDLADSFLEILCRYQGRDCGMVRLAFWLLSPMGSLLIHRGREDGRPIKMPRCETHGYWGGLLEPYI